MQKIASERDSACNLLKLYDNLETLNILNAKNKVEIRVIHIIFNF
jgi:hypothetical protein